MLRCNAAGLIPIMSSKKYTDEKWALYEKRKSAFESAMKYESYYILRYLPADLAKHIGEDKLRETLTKQKKSGMWKIKDAERITYDIYCALKHIGILDECASSGNIKYDTMAQIEDNYEFYPLLMKKNIFGKLSEKDHAVIDEYTEEILGTQKDNGSWGDTVVGTSVNLDKLCDLGFDTSHSAVQAGCEYLFANLNSTFPANHVGSPYGFEGDNMFSTTDRQSEFEAAQNLKPEWIARAVCFHHIGMIQNSFAIMTLQKLGLGEDEKISSAIDNMYSIFSEFGGFCDSDIKKKYVDNNGIKL